MNRDAREKRLRDKFGKLPEGHQDRALDIARALHFALRSEPDKARPGKGGLCRDARQG